MTSSLPSPAVEPITCQSWCQDRDGHPTQRVREDQCCFGVEHRVHLSTEPSVLMSDGRTVPTYLTTYLLRQADDTAPRVFIGYDEDGEPVVSAVLYENPSAGMGTRNFITEILEIYAKLDRDGKQELIDYSQQLIKEQHAA